MEIIPFLPLPKVRENKGRFISVSNNNGGGDDLPDHIKYPLYGNLLGDGSILFNKKTSEGKAKPNTNAQYCMTLKSREYIFHLCSNFYKTICTNNMPKGWPNSNLGKPVTKYHFKSRALPVISNINSQWYKWDEQLKKYVKIVPLNISELLTPIGLAIWIMDDGYANGNGVVLCTDSFTLAEVELLMNVLKNKFGLVATLQHRTIAGKHSGWRIYISGKPENRALLFSIVEPYFIPSMLYKLGKGV
jgi:hypothetical protein